MTPIEPKSALSGVPLAGALSLLLGALGLWLAFPSTAASITEGNADLNSFIIFEPTTKIWECEYGTHQWEETVYGSSAGMTFLAAGKEWGPYCPYHLAEWLELHIPKVREVEP